MYKNLVEIYCFIPKCDTSIKHYRISLNYIIQSFYRLKNRKNHDTLDFEKNKEAHQIFFSFLSLFKRMEFKNVRNLNIFLYGLTLSDEKNLQILDEDFLNKFYDIMKKIGKTPFKLDVISEFNNEIEEFIEKMEKIFPQDNFKETKDIIINELIECKLFF